MAEKQSERGGGADDTPRAASPDEGVQSYVAPEVGAVEQKAPSSMGKPEPEQVEASTPGEPKRE